LTMMIMDLMQVGRPIRWGDLLYFFSWKYSQQPRGKGVD